MVICYFDPLRHPTSLCINNLLAKERAKCLFEVVTVSHIERAANVIYRHDYFVNPNFIYFVYLEDESRGCHNNF